MFYLCRVFIPPLLFLASLFHNSVQFAPSEIDLGNSSQFPAVDEVVLSPRTVFKVLFRLQTYVSGCDSFSSSMRLAELATLTWQAKYVLCLLCRRGWIFEKLFSRDAILTCLFYFFECQHHVSPQSFFLNPVEIVVDQAQTPSFFCISMVLLFELWLGSTRRLARLCMFNFWTNFSCIFIHLD